MKLLFIIFISTFALTSSCNAYSQWYETQGQAYINNNDTKSARNKAIENALKKTLLIAGASVSSVQQVVNGLLTKDEVNIRATGIVNAFEIVSENYANSVATVTIRADIFPQEKQCFSADYRKTLLLTRSHILQREQANIGNIYQIDSAMSKQLNLHLQNDSRYLQTKLNTKNKTPFSRFLQSSQQEKVKALTMALADSTDSQFVLFSEITDLSFDKKVNNKWQFWQSAINDRHFNLTIYIFDGANGELVFEKAYRSTTPWQYDKRESVNVLSNEFWQSSYGLKINSLLKDISLDIDELLMCQPTQGKIVSVDNNKLLINLGKIHGVKIGDQFSLLTSANFHHDNGKIYAGFNVSPYKVKVVSTSRNSSTLMSVNDEQLGNIQINDMAVRY